MLESGVSSYFELAARTSLSLSFSLSLSPTREGKMTAFCRTGFIAGPVFAVSREIRYVVIARPCNYRNGHDYLAPSV